MKRIYVVPTVVASLRFPPEMRDEILSEAGLFGFLMFYSQLLHRAAWNQRGLTKAPVM